MKQAKKYPYISEPGKYTTVEWWVSIQEAPQASRIIAKCSYQADAERIVRALRLLQERTPTRVRIECVSSFHSFRRIEESEEGTGPHEDTCGRP